MITFIVSLVIAIVACLSLIYRFKDISLRAGLIIIVVASSLVNFWLITLYAGKPLATSPPEDMIVYGYAVDIKNEKIYIMQKEPEHDFPPLFIWVPYNRELGDVLNKGSKRAKGKPFRVKRKGKRGKENDGETNKGSISLESMSWELVPLPDPKLPPKNQ
jgi:hypothetical protein